MSPTIKAKTHLPKWRAIFVVTVILVFGYSLPMHNQAIAETISISELDRQQAEKLLQQGKSKFEKQDYQGAIADFSQAIQINPESADLYYQRGLVLEDLGDKPGAIRDFDSAILRNPHHAWAYLHRAGLSFNFGLNLRVTDLNGADWRVIDYAAHNSQALLDLKTARDLFAQQGDEQGYQIANNLLRHFNQRFEQ